MKIAALSWLEKELIVEALKLAKGNITAAVRRYGINWKLYRLC